MGVYQIKNTVNGKLFIGSSMNLPGSLNGSRFKLNANAHPNRQLQADWNRYGPAAFSFEVIETINPDKIDEADWQKAVAALEEKWLAELRPFGDNGYNQPQGK